MSTVLGRITAIVPNHTSTDAFLGDAVRSLRSQTVPIEQIVIINDTESRGPAWARNAAARCAQGGWLLLLDADDTIAPEFVAECERAAGADTVAIIPSASPLTNVIDLDNYLPYCALIRRDVWHALGGHQEPSARGCGLCDWDFWIRLWRWQEEHRKLGHYPLQIGYIPPTMFTHRERADSMSKWSMTHFAEMRADMWSKYGISEVTDAH